MKLLIRKAHIKAHDRSTPSGGKAWVREHEDTRKSPTPEIGGKWYGAGQQTGAQTHTFPGGFMTNPDTGTTHWVKQGLDDDQTRVEHLSNRLYRRLGVKVAPTSLVTQGGQLRVASQAVPGAQKVNPEALPGHPDVHRGFVADAWLGAYDVAGMDHSNLLRDKEGGVVRIDQGGSLHRRAQGKVKTAEQWGTEVKELASMLDPKINSKTAAMFGKLTPQEIIEGIKAVTALSNHDIEDEVERAGLSPKTAEMLIWRREDLRHKSRAMERAMKSEAEGGKLPEPIKPTEGSKEPKGGSEKIPDMWLASATTANEKKGMDPKAAQDAAIQQWLDQGKMAAEHEAQQSPEEKPGGWWAKAAKEDQTLKTGMAGTVRWTHSHGYYTAKAEIVKLAGKVMKVRLMEKVTSPSGGWDEGHIITVPRAVDLKRFTANNRFELEGDKS